MSGASRRLRFGGLGEWCCCKLALCAGGGAAARAAQCGTLMERCTVALVEDRVDAAWEAGLKPRCCRPGSTSVAVAVFDGHWRVSVPALEVGKGVAVL